jgi:MFS family permease
MLLFEEDTPLQWRLFYVVALLPLLVVAYLRRSLRETRAFGIASSSGRVQRRWIPHVEAGDRARLWRIAVVLGLLGMLDTTTFFYASELAQDTYEWGDLFTLVVVAAAPTTLAGYVVGGRLSDRVGRKPALAGALLGFVLGTIVVFTEQPALFAVGFFVLTGSDAALQAVRASYLGELFPTEVRATLAAFVSAIVVAGGSLGLVIVGALADVVEPSRVLIAMAVVVAVAAWLLRPLPETAGTDVMGTEPA